MKAISLLLRGRDCVILSVAEGLLQRLEIARARIRV